MMFFRVGRRGLGSVALLLGLCMVDAGPAAAALLRTQDVAAWQRFYGLDRILAYGFRYEAMTAYENDALEDAVVLLGLTADFLPADGEVLGRWGFALKQLGHYELARDALFRAVAEEPENFHYWWWLGDAQRLLGDYGAAYENMMTARDLAPQEQRSELSDFADFTAALASGVKSWQDFDRHRSFAERHGENRRHRRQIVELKTALDRAPEARADDLENRARLAYTCNNIGTLYLHLKEAATAVDYFLESARLYDRDQSPEDVMRVEQNLGLAFTALAAGDPGRAAAYGERALRHWAATGELAGVVGDIDYVRYADGMALAVASRLYPPDRAEVAALREKIKPEIPWSGPINDFSVAAVCVGEGLCRLAEGDYAGARIMIEMVKPFFENSQFLADSEIHVGLLAQLSESYLRQGRFQRAVDLAYEGIVALNDLRQYMDGDAFLRSNNGAMLQGLSALALEAWIGQEEWEQALRLFEGFATRRMKDMLGAHVWGGAAKGDREAELVLLQQRIPQLESALAAMTDDDEAGERARREERLAEDRRRLAWLEETAPFPPAHRISIASVEAAAPAAIQAALGDGTAMLCVLSGPQGGVALVVDGEKIGGVVLPLLRQEQGGIWARAWPGSEAALAELGAAFAPLTEMLAPYSRLYLAVDETMGQLPLEVILARDRLAFARIAAGSYLLQDLGEKSGATALVQTTEGAALLPPDFGAGMLEKVGDEAREGWVRAPSEAVSLLFVAAEADFAHTDPMGRALLLAGDVFYDGALHAAELLSTDPLPYGMVVLGVTGAPGRHGGYDWMPFVEGFYHTGVPGLIAPLWPVAGELVGEVLTAIAQGAAAAGPGAALQGWQEEARAAGRSAEEWGAFQVFGPGGLAALKMVEAQP